MNMLSKASQLVFRGFLSPFIKLFSISDGLRLYNARTLMSYYFFKESVGLGQYEHGAFNSIMKHISAKGLLIDIGANEGYSSLRLSKALPRQHIISLEASPGTFALLGRNIKLNNLTNITTLNLAASDIDDKVVSMAISCNYYRSHGSLNNKFTHKSSDTEEAHTITIDTLLKRVASKDSVSFIKIDVEGHEINVLNGASQTIQSYRPVTLLECQSSSILDYVYHTLGSAYMIFELKKAKLSLNPANTYQGMNLLLLPINAG